MAKELFPPSTGGSEEHWISISDMMAALMIIFLLIAISYMLLMKTDRDRMKDIAVTYQNLKDDLYTDLYNEFEEDLNRWDAVIEPDGLIIRFSEPDVLFETGESKISFRFKEILEDFFPRYIQVLNRGEYIDDIAEVRIEGHTSSEWQGTTDPQIAYFKNMELSQDRTRSVLEYSLTKTEAENRFDWLRKHVTANGLSSSQPITNTDGEELRSRSRRVEFRVITQAEKRIEDIMSQDLE